MEILYSGTDKILCDSLTLMLAKSRIEHETSKRLYSVQINDADELHQVFVHGGDWDSAARMLDMLTRSTHCTEASTSVNAGSRRQYAALVMISLVIAAGLGATKLLHSTPNPCLFLPQPTAPIR